MKKFNLILSLFSILIVSNLTFSQTVAMDFEGLDCNNNQVHLFSDLDNGQAVVLFYYMANCGSCPPKAQEIQTMANNINATHPNLVKGYAFPYNNFTTCTYSSSWVTSNNIPLYAPMDSGAVQVAYYGGFGMPTVVLVGGIDHHVMFSSQDFIDSDTTTMRDLILGLLNANTTLINQNTIDCNVYPNPCSDKINISINSSEKAELKIEMYDVNGRLIQEMIKEMEVSGPIKKEIDISKIKQGSYILRIKLGDVIKNQNINIVH